MFHLRWARTADQLSAAIRIVGDPDDETRINAVRERMVDRVWFVGSSQTTAPIIEASFREAISVLDKSTSMDRSHWRQPDPLMPFLRSQVGGLFTPWTLANERAMAQGDEEFTVELDKGTWTQKPQKYHARSLGMLREKYAALASTPLIDRVLADANCASLLQR